MRHLLPAAIIGLLVGPAPPAGADEPPRLRLQEARERSTGMPVRYGTFTVFEDRAAGTGRTLDLDVVVLPATGADRRPDPVFHLAGGPGLAAADRFRGHLGSWMNVRRDIVLVSQRGTGGGNRLDCDLFGSDDDVQAYLEPLFAVEALERCRAELSKRADLALYTTPIAADDLDEVRAALGYERINLHGGSYGSRAALIYMRRHPRSVRSAILIGIAPPAFTNPLYHAQGGQRALDMVFAACAADPACRGAYPDLERKLQAVLDRLERAPARATVRHPASGRTVDVRLSRDAFAGSLRIMMYYGSRDVPRLVHAAFEDDYDAFAQRALDHNRSLRDAVAFGMLLCVTCSEDLPRIDPDDIDRLTGNTFLGDARVRRQLEACGAWPRGEVGDDYGEPVTADVPVLLLSGEYDPVTPPRWGEHAARHLPRGRHLVVPGAAHDPGGPCVEHVMRQFLESPDAEDLDASCLQHLRLPRFEIERR